MSSQENVIRRPADSRWDELDEASLDRLRQALEDLRLEIRTRRPEEPELPQAGTDVDWPAFFDVLRLYFGRFGMGERGVPNDEFGLDLNLLKRAEPVLEFLRERYWRVQLGGTENVPSDGPCLFVANRSGLLPYDGLMLAHVLTELDHGSSRTRFMVADALVTQPFMQPWLARLGGVRACRENADRLLRHGHSVIAFPEGDAGAAKVYGDRYQLERFERDGAVQAAIEMGVPMLPVGIVGAEEVHPLLAKLPPPARLPGLPFMPVTPTFPLLGPLGCLPLPANWVIEFGHPLQESMPEDAPDEEIRFARATGRLRERVEALVDAALERRSSVWS